MIYPKFGNYFRHSVRSFDHSIWKTFSFIKRGDTFGCNNYADVEQSMWIVERLKSVAKQICKMIFCWIYFSGCFGIKCIISHHKYWTDRFRWRLSSLGWCERTTIITDEFKRKRFTRWSSFRTIRFEYVRETRRLCVSHFPLSPRQANWEKQK